MGGILRCYVHSVGDALQDRVHRLFYESLPPFGVLALGQKESISFSPFADRYEERRPGTRIFRKIG